MKISEEKLEEARDFYEQYLAFRKVGFTKRQATTLLSRPRIVVSAQYPPEVHEFWERQNALATKLMVEMDDDA